MFVKNIKAGEWTTITCGDRECKIKFRSTGHRTGQLVIDSPDKSFRLGMGEPTPDLVAGELDWEEILRKEA